MQNFDRFSIDALPKVEKYLQRCVRVNASEGLEELHRMLRYHLGWEGEGAGVEARGKRIRPMIVLLTTVAGGGSWEQAVPAAAAVELVHNFSLIHDDIQDRSEFRRGRETVWKKWGVAQAINAGDALFSLAHISLQHLQETIPMDRKVRASNILRQACLTLTQGQFLDLDYESRGTLSLKSYWPMIKGKTASLLAACAELGALIAGADGNVLAAYRDFGMNIGLAFQVHDDYLGIWGNAAKTGKSVESDLLSGKKSLPILFGLEKDDEFAARWQNGNISSAFVGELAGMLEREGAKEFTINTVNQLTQKALNALNAAQPVREGKVALVELANMLAKRDT